MWSSNLLTQLKGVKITISNLFSQQINSKSWDFSKLNFETKNRTLIRFVSYKKRWGRIVFSFANHLINNCVHPFSLKLNGCVGGSRRGAAASFSVSKASKARMQCDDAFFSSFRSRGEFSPLLFLVACFCTSSTSNASSTIAFLAT